MYTDKVIHRGEVWYIDFSGSSGYETGAGRPGIVLSNDMQCACSSTLTIVYLTTSPEKAQKSYNVEVTTTNRKSWAIVNDIYTVDKRRFKSKMCDLRLDEMAAVESAVISGLGLGNSVERQNESDNRDWDNLEMERDYYKRLYEKAIDHFASVQLRKMVEPNVISEGKTSKDNLLGDKVPEHKAQEHKTCEDKPQEEESPEKPDINVCEKRDLINAGMRSDLADEVMENRPYRNIREILSLPSINKIQYEIFKNKLVVVPIKQEKETVPQAIKPEKKKMGCPRKLVNINTITEKELLKLGFGEATAKKLSAWIRNNGPISSEEELAKMPRMGKLNMAKLQGKIKFEEDAQ